MLKNKKLICICLVLISIFLFVNSAYANENDDSCYNNIKLQINNPYMLFNGESIEIDPGRNTVPIIKNDRTLIPIRSVIEALDGSVYWNESTKKVTILINNKKVELWIDNPNMIVDGVKKEIDPKRGTTPIIVNGRTMLPIPQIIKVIGGKVEWNAERKEISIKLKKNNSIDRNLIGSWKGVTGPSGRLDEDAKFDWIFNENGTYSLYYKPLNKFLKGNYRIESNCIITSNNIFDDKDSRPNEKWLYTFSQKGNLSIDRFTEGTNIPLYWYTKVK